MSFAEESGYTPLSIEDLISQVREAVNEEFGTDYTVENFVGTNWYRFVYAVMQIFSENQIKTAEIFQKVQEYIRTTNDTISRPTVSFPGLLEAFEEEEYTVAVRPMDAADRGLISICVDIAAAITGVRAKGSFVITNFANLVSGTDDSVGVGATTFTFQTGAVTPGDATAQAATSNAATASSLASQINAHATAGALVKAKAIDSTVFLEAILPGTAGNSIAMAYTDNDTNVGATKSGTALTGGTAAASEYADVKTAVAELIRDFVVAGVVTEGAQEETVTLSNGQDFDFKFELPDRIPVVLRLTATLSPNHIGVVPTDEEIRQAIYDSINANYRLGWDFEPQRYYTIDDAPWAATLLLEWKADGTNWHSTVFEAEHTEIFTFGLEDIDVEIT